MHLLFYRLVRWRVEASASGHIKELAARPINLMQVIKYADAFILARLQKHRARAVAEKNAGRAVFKVDYARHHVGSDDDYFCVRARLDELRPDRERIEEPRAGSRNVEAPGAAGANLVLDHASRRREEHIGRDRGDDDDLYFVGFNSALMQKVGDSLRGQF